MKAIIKGREPHSLITHRLTPYADYDNYPDKVSLRRALASEQRGLCCYCMGPIRPEASAMKIEHWRCQSRYPDEQLDYNNLLGACMGGEGRSQRRQHCDTRKGDRDLLWNPAEPVHAIESRVQYGADGTIESDNETLDSQLNEILNLNLALLKQNRKSVLDAVLQWWKRRKPVPRHRIERQIRRLAPADGSLDPYCQVAVWWLNRKLSRMPR
ncbi:MAG: TIGR02646 family protein [Rhodospirillaceae bacterium]|nr:TIGR02646 family protein [Rhodospirillaceae bacterium]MYH37287.1 TIGR02646 family protein [Rhodospirillaceae bacterium]MYK14875.1 TIGR02646 family protein [Rhodospirillaceae bacterium]